MTNKRCKILGYNVDLLSFKDAAAFVSDKMAKNQGLHIITINPEIMALADRYSELADIINKSELVLPESAGIKIALRFKGIKQEKIPGIDFSKELLHICSRMNYPVSLIGAKEDILVNTLENLKKEFPNLDIVYSHNGYFKDDEIIINKLKESKPKFILCALGAPKQELFVNKCIKLYSNAIYIGIGGSFDVWAGKVKRAPLILQKSGLEWLYRTLKQPSRLKRIYKTLPMFLFRAIIECVRK